MGSSLGCFGEENGNDTVCYVLVGVTGLSLFLLVVALIILCCVCYYRKKRRRQQRQDISILVQREPIPNAGESGGDGEVPKTQSEFEVTNYAYIRVKDCTPTVVTDSSMIGESERGHHYQEMGITDYEHMYSTSLQKAQDVDHYTILSPKTLEGKTIYTTMATLKQYFL